MMDKAQKQTVRYVKQNGEDREKQGRLYHRTTKPEASVLLKYNTKSKGNQIQTFLQNTWMSLTCDMVSYPRTIKSSAIRMQKPQNLHYKPC
jgi:hypothetical protein